MHPAREGSQAATSQVQGAASVPASPRALVDRGPYRKSHTTHLHRAHHSPQLSHCGDRAAPEASPLITLGPSAPSGGKLRGPQPGWPRTPFSPLACSALHSGSPSRPQVSCCNGWGPGAIQAARVGKKCRRTRCWEPGLPQHCPPWLPGKWSRPLP